MPNIYDEHPQHFQDTITFVYSSGCVEALKELLKESAKIYQSDIELEDICNYGVFCDVDIYATYKEMDEIESKCDVPAQVSDCATYSYDERRLYIQDTMERVMRGDMEKPKWMVYMEMYKSCNIYNDAPSTFLYLEPKEKRFKKYCEALVNFLYSPNLINKFKK